MLVGYEGFARICELLPAGRLCPRRRVAAARRAARLSSPSTLCVRGEAAIEVRDRHCQHPSGFDEPAERCQVDHKVPYALGGLTTQENGRLLCAVHNRQRVAEMAGAGAGAARGP